MKHVACSIGKRPWRVILLGMCLTLPAAVLASGCGIAAVSGSSGTTLTLYSAQHEQTTDAMIAAFTKQTGIKVRVANNDEDVLTAQITQEGDLSPADVFYTENSNWLEQLNDQGLLSKVDSSTLANVPRQDSAANGDWAGVSARISVLIYNTSKLKPSELPKSVMELGDPKWLGKIEIAPDETDLWPVVSSIDRAKGHRAALRWLIKLEINAAGNDNVPDNETITRDVSQGVSELGLINHYYYYRLVAEVGKGSVKSNIAYFAAHDPGYVEDISGVGILKSSKHKAAAQKLVSFMTSVAGQKVLAESESFEYPIHPGVAANAELTPLSKLQPTSFTPAELGTGFDAKALLEEAGLI
ncbi:MAG TPA: extracellular solute-binding protein [Solirubrobacteraceae bacterium]